MKLIYLVLSVFLCSQVVMAKEYKVLVQDFLPLDGRNSRGKFTGAHVEITEAVCKKLKYDCKFELVPIRRGEEMIAKGEADFFLGLSSSSQRNEFAYFGPMLTTSGYTFFTKVGKSGKYSSVEDLAGTTVAVYGPSTTSRSLEAIHEKMNKKFKVTQEASTDIPFKKLDSNSYGEKSLVYSNRAVGIYMNKILSLSIEPVGFDTEKINHGAMLSKKSFNSEEYKKVWNAYKEVMNSEEGKRVLAFWHMDSYSGPAETGP